MKRRADHRRQSGNVFFALFGAVALVGAVGASTMSIMKGPVRSMHNVTQRTIAENAMIAAGKLTIMAASQPGGDCDGDNVVEPPGFVPGGTAPHPQGGGLLPSSVGAAKQDPWGNEFGYCVWDHGDAVKSGACADDASRLSGRQDGVGIVVAVISSGPDRIFQTSCNDEGAGDYVDKPSGSDDVTMTYTYDEAVATAGGAGLWMPIGADAAEIQRSLEVKADDGSGPVFAVDNSAGGPSIKVDFIQQLSAGAVEFLSGIRGTDATLSGDLGVTGAATLGDTDIAGDLSATGAATFGSADVAGNLEVGGSTTLEALSAGATSVGSLAASGIATLNSLAVTTNAQVGGTLTASGHTTLDTVEAAGLASVESLSVTNEAGIGGALDVTGASTLTSLLTSGGITVGTDLSVTGNTNVATLAASGLATLDTLGVTNGASIGGQLNMTGGNIANLADPTNAADAATKSYVDAQVAAGTGFEEQDPQVGDLASGKWCNSDGSVINCTDDLPLPPGDGDTLAGLECADGEIPKRVGGAWSCAPDRNDGTEQSCFNDELTWTARTAAEPNAWHNVIYGNELFVAVVDNTGTGTNRVMTSPDGITWTARTAPAMNWIDIAYGNGLFVAVAYGGGQIMTSADGITWTAQSPSVTGLWRSVIYGDGIFVAADVNGKIMTSPDGLTWTERTGAEANSWESLAYGNGLFVAISADGTHQVMYSPDGATWTAADAANSNTWFHLTYGNGLFVAAASGSDDNLIMTSPDGMTWTSVPVSPAIGGWQALTYGGGMFVALAYGEFVTSTDGTTWTSGDLENRNWHDLAFGAGAFVALGDNSTVMTMPAPSCSGGGLEALTCEDGEILKFNGAAEAWECGPDAGGDDLGDHTATTALDMATNAIVNLADPTNAQDAATKAYVDAAVAGCQTGPVGTVCADGAIYAGELNGTRLYAAPADENGTLTWNNGTTNYTTTGATSSTDGMANTSTLVGLSDAGASYEAAAACRARGAEWYLPALDELNVLYTNRSAIGNFGTNFYWSSSEYNIYHAKYQQFSDGTQNSHHKFNDNLVRCIRQELHGSGDNLGDHTATTDLDLDGNDILDGGTINATAFVGDGSGLTGISDTLAGLTCASGEIAKWNGSIWTCAPDRNDGTEQSCTGGDEDWTAVAPPEANGWVSVTYGNGLFVATATAGGGDPIMTSPDGVNWTSRTAPGDYGWLEVTYGDGLFVAVANSGTHRVMTSPDGINWTARTAAEDNYWKGVTYGDGLYVAVASTGTNRIMTSPDGVTWTAGAAPENNQWRSVTYGNGLFVAVATSGTNRIMTSSDGVTWTSRAAPEANGWYSVTYGGGLFVAVANSGTNRIMTSPDGITWTARAAPQSNVWTSVTYGGGLFVGVANSGTDRIMTSPDGITWTGETAPAASAWVRVSYGDGRFVAVANSGTNRVMTWAPLVCVGGGGGADNLGDHTATQDINASGHDLVDVGNLGIGSTSPSVPLEIHKTAPMIVLQDTDNTAAQNALTGYISLRDSNGDQYGWFGDGAPAGNVLNFTGVGRAVALNADGPRLIANTNGSIQIPGFINSDGGGLGLKFLNGAMSMDMGTYDVWLQGNTTSTAMSADRNLALLGVKADDTLRINYNSEYTGGTVIGGPVSVTGAMTATGSVTASAYYQSSDRNLKTDIRTIADPFALLDGIEGKHFLWKDSGEGAYGVIAQDVEAVMPEAIGENDDGYMTVEYSQLIGPLIEAVKQLKSEIQELRADNDNLQAANDNLREDVRALKAGGD